MSVSRNIPQHYRKSFVPQFVPVNPSRPAVAYSRAFKSAVFKASVFRRMLNWFIK
jgi:hypothetical protein